MKNIKLFKKIWKVKRENFRNSSSTVRRRFRPIMVVMTRMASIFYLTVTFLISKAIILIRRVTTIMVVSTTMTTANTSHPQMMMTSLITTMNSAAQTTMKKRKKAMITRARIQTKKSTPTWKMALKNRPPMTMALTKQKPAKVSGESTASQLSSGSSNSHRTKNT